MEFKRLFSRHHAEETLPLVARIVEDILVTAREARALMAEAGQDTLALTDRIQEYLEEIEALGAFYKDWSYSVGLVDFPAVIDEEIVFLCWRTDEPRLAYYHRIPDGFAGRQPLPPDWTGEDPP